MIGRNTINPEIDFPKIENWLKKDAIRQGDTFGG